MNSPPAATEVQTLASIHSYHAHVYFGDAEARVRAERLRERIAARFAVQLGRWHEVPVGPHSMAMYQVAFATPQFATLLPWLMLNRDTLSILVHPNTLAPRDDHLRHALWLGDALPLRESALPLHIDAAQETPVVPNTQATTAP